MQVGPPVARLSRRAVGRGTAGFLAATTLLVTGCDAEESLDLPGLPDLGREEPDLERVRTGLRDEQAVLDQLDRVRQRHRTLRRALAPAAAVHGAHVRLLRRAVDDQGGTGAAPDGSRPPVPRDPARAVAELISLERSLAESHVQTAMRSQSGVLARMVAAMSAAAAQQEVVLRELVAEQAAADPGADR